MKSEQLVSPSANSQSSSQARLSFSDQLLLLAGGVSVAALVALFFGGRAIGRGLQVREVTAEASENQREIRSLPAVEVDGIEGVRWREAAGSEITVTGETMRWQTDNEVSIWQQSLDGGWQLVGHTGAASIDGSVPATIDTLVQDGNRLHVVAGTREWYFYAGAAQ